MADLQVQMKAWRVGFRSGNCLSDSQWDSRRLDTESRGWGSTTVGPLVRVLIFCLEPVNSSSVKDLRTYIEGPEKNPQIDLPAS